MGAYLSRPITDKISDDQSNTRLSYGVSSMQGWRIKQEDAHNCIMDFDDDTSLFGVYDGHGGFEVAQYTSEKLPDFIRNTKKYQECSYKEALIEAFLGFDGTIPTPDVITVLQNMVDADKLKEKEEREKNRTKSEDSNGSDHITSNLVCVRRTHDDKAGCSSSDGEWVDDDLESPESLRLDASKPIEEVMASYPVPTINKLMNSEIGAKPASPYLRGRREPGAGKSTDSCNSNSIDECGPSSLQNSNSGFGASGDDQNGVSGDSNESVVNEESNESASKCGKSSRVTSDESTEENSSSKCSNSGPSGEGLVNGCAIPLNGDITNDVDIQNRPKRASSGPSNAPTEVPSTSPKKKKLALDDLDDSTVVKNFISNDEIDESDEDDSEDETFQPSEENLDSDDDDEDDDDDESSSFHLGAGSFAESFSKRLRECAYSDDDDEDEDDEGVDVDDEEGASSQSDKSDDLDEETAEEEDEEEDAEVKSEEESDCDKDVICSREKPGFDSGCTAVVALMKKNRLYVANAGDSRCVICKAGNAIDMSEDHKPEDAAERSRIRNAGGKVTLDGRVDGGLNLSRAIGDHCYKKNKDLPDTEQMITALPDVREIELDPEIEFIVLACDGIWNSMSSQEVVDFIRPKIESNQKLSSICEELFDKCLAEFAYTGDGTGCDNMTCIIVKLIHDGESAKDDAELCSSIAANDDPSAPGSEANAAEKSEAPHDDSVKPAGERSGESENATDAVTSAPVTKAQKRNSKELVADAESSCKKLKTDDTAVEDSNSCVVEAV